MIIINDNDNVFRQISTQLTSLNIKLFVIEFDEKKNDELNLSTFARTTKKQFVLIYNAKKNRNEMIFVKHKLNSLFFQLLNSHKMNTLKILMISKNLKSYLNAKIKVYANEKIEHEAFIKLLQSIIKSIESISKKKNFSLNVDR